jgi:hypothetical protein
MHRVVLVRNKFSYRCTRTLLKMNIWKLYLQHYVRGSCNVLTIYFLRSMILVMYKLNKNHNKYYETKGVVKCNVIL